MPVWRVSETTALLGTQVPDHTKGGEIEVLVYITGARNNERMESHAEGQQTWDAGRSYQTIVMEAKLSSVVVRPAAIATAKGCRPMEKFSGDGDVLLWEFLSADC